MPSLQLINRLCFLVLAVMSGYFGGNLSIRIRAEKRALIYGVPACYKSLSHFGSVLGVYCVESARKSSK